MKKGFTLAEILITLVIIGVVAALTVPVLNRKINEVIFQNAYKKTFATLENANNMGNSNDEHILTVTQNGASYTTKTDFNAFLKYLKIEKTCQPTDICWTQNNVKGLNGSDINASDYRFDDAKTNPGSSAWILSDGTIIKSTDKMWGTGSTSIKILPILVDLNGLKGPNTLGLDIHIMTFYASPTKLVSLRPDFNDAGYNYLTLAYNRTKVSDECQGQNVSATANTGYTCGVLWLNGNK